jgi:hypothetical protein
MMVQLANSVLCRPIVNISRSHTHTVRHTHRRLNSSERVIGSLRSRHLRRTQETQEKNTHALIGIRTRDPSNQAAADLRLSPQG